MRELMTNFFTAINWDISSRIVNYDNFEKKIWMKSWLRSKNYKKTGSTNEIFINRPSLSTLIVWIRKSNW